MNILVIRFTSLGDLVTLEPLFRAIRYFYKGANIDFLTSGIGKGLYADTDFFNDYIIYDNYSNTLNVCKRKKYDLVFNLHCNALSNILILFISKKKVIYSAANMWQKIIGKKIKVKPISETLINSGLEKEIVDDYFKQISKSIISLPVCGKSIITTVKKTIVISIGSSEFWKSKQWGVSKYSKLIEKLLENNFEIVLVGTKLELNDSKKIIQDFPNILNYVNKTNLTQLKNILFNADLYIGNDSGPSHIAAAVGTNTITIFGSTSIKHCVKFAPYLGKHICIQPSSKIKCHPCYKGVCPTNMECMEDISVSKVYDEVQAII